MHTIDQGEGGEQGDPLMPLLFALGQHGALEAVQRTLRGDERFVVASLHRELFTHARIRSFTDRQDRKSFQ